MGQALRERASHRLSHGTGFNGSGGAEAETEGVGWVGWRHSPPPTPNLHKLGRRGIFFASSGRSAHWDQKECVKRLDHMQLIKEINLVVEVSQSPCWCCPAEAVALTSNHGLNSVQHLLKLQVIVPGNRYSTTLQTQRDCHKDKRFPVAA